MKALCIILFIEIVNAFASITTKYFNSKPLCLRLSHCINEADPQNNKDLLVVGASITGIGGRIIKSHRLNFPNATIVGETLTSSNHEYLRKLNCIPRLCNESHIEMFNNVIISVPAYKNTSQEYNNYYKSIVKNAISRWNKNGKLVFASSGGVYKENKGNYVTEDSEINTEHILYDCEQLIKNAGGTSLRFAALYGFNKGDFWNYLKYDKINVNPNMIIEMCNYDDAASAFMTILNTNQTLVAKKVFNVCDGRSKTIKEILLNCIKVYEYSGANVPDMTGNNTNLGKKYNITNIQKLGWTPRWKSFESWCRTYSYIQNPASNAIVFYNERKIKDTVEKKYSIQNIDDVRHETLLICIQFFAFVFVELYLFLLPTHK